MRDDTTKACNELSRKVLPGREKAGVYKCPGSVLADNFADGLPVQPDFPSFPGLVLKQGTPEYRNAGMPEY